MSPGVWLEEALADSHGLRVRAVRRMAGGFTSTCYLVDTDRGPLVVKVWSDDDDHVGAARQRTLALLESLFDAQLDGRFPRAVAARTGAFVSRSAAGPFAVLSFVEGHTPPGWPEWPSAVLVRLGRVLAQVHGATGRLGAPPSLRDPYECSFESPLRAALGRLAAGAHHGRDVVESALLRSIVPRLAEVQAQLDLLARLRDGAAARTQRLVLCHTDVGGDNLVVDAGGSVGVLDWDEAGITAPLADFALVIRDQGTGEPLRAVLAGYVEAGGTPDLSVDVAAFFLLRRALADVAARVALALDPNAARSRRESAVAGIDTWGFEQWRRLDATLDSVRELAG